MLTKARFRGRVLAFGGALLMSLAMAQAVSGSTVSSSALPRLAYVTGTARSTPTVWVATADGGQPTRLGPGLDPLLAPNGEAVAAGLFGATPNSEQGSALGIYSTARPAKPTGEYLSLSTVTATPLAWSPDSRYLAVDEQSTAVTNSAAGSGLVVIDTSTGTMTTIARGQIYGASFAPDGSDRLVFARSPSLVLTAPTNLYTSGPDGSGVRPITHNGRSLNPVWGPRYIAYDRERPRKNDASVFQIWLASPSGGASRRLTGISVRALVEGLVPLEFSADGSRLLTQFEGQDTSEAWTVLVSSGRVHRLSVRGQPVMAAGISGDGRTVLIDEKGFEGPPSGGRVSSIPFVGGRPRVLVAHGSQASWNR